MMKPVMALALIASAAVPAVASPDYKCKGDRVENGGSTHFTIRHSGGACTIERGGSTTAKVVSRGGKFSIEVGGSTKATIDGNRIENSGSSWGAVSDAQREFDCDGPVAGSLWAQFTLGIVL